MSTEVLLTFLPVEGNKKIHLSLVINVSNFSYDDRKQKIPKGKKRGVFSVFSRIPSTQITISFWSDLSYSFVLNYNKGMITTFIPSFVFGSDLRFKGTLFPVLSKIVDLVPTPESSRHKQLTKIEFLRLKEDRNTVRHQNVERHPESDFDPRVEYIIQ